MYTRLLISLLLFLNAVVLFANNWTNGYYAHSLKTSALKNEKVNVTAAVEQYIELGTYYAERNDDSLIFFRTKALSLALLSNDKNLIALSWLMQVNSGNNAKANNIANAKLAINKNSTDAIVYLIKVYENDNDYSPEFLDEIDSVLIANEQKVITASETDRLIYAFLLYRRASMGFALDTDFRYPANISLGSKIFLEKKLMNYYIFTLGYEGRVLFIRGLQSEALRLNFYAKDQAKKLGNIKLYLSSLTHLGYNAKEAKQYDVAEKACLELVNLSLSPEIRPTTIGGDKLTETLNTLYLINYAKKDYKKALSYITQCIFYADSLAKLHSEYDSTMALDARFNLGVFHASTGNNDKAIPVFLNLLKNKDVVANPFFYAPLCSNVGTSYVEMGNFIKGLRYLNYAQPIVEQYLGWFDKQCIYKFKRLAFRGLGRLDSAMYYTDLYEIANDSLFNIDKQHELAEVTEKYNNDKLTAENDKLSAEAELSKTKEVLLYVVIGVGILLLALLFIVYRNRLKLKEKQSLLIVAEKKNLTNQLIAKKAKEAQYELDLQLKEAKALEIQSQLEFKSRETTSMATVALQNANLLVEIQGIIKGINGNQEENNRIMREVNSLIGNQKHLEAFWDTFRKYFQEVHPRFFDILEECHPSLTLNDQKICSYLVLGMGTNEISMLQNIEARSFLRYRQRLKEKLGLETSEEIEPYLNGLS